MAKVTARFYVSTIEFGAGTDNAGKVTLMPAYANGANAAWASATPSGRIELYVNAEGAMAQFNQWRLQRKDLHITLETVEDAEGSAAV